MRHVEIELRKTGNPADLEHANAISEMLKQRGVDVSPYIAETATQVEVKPFSKEALEFLKRKELLHYSLNGQSLKAQKLAGRPFWYIVDVGDNFLTLPSIQSEVAFHPSPDKFFLPKSNKLTLSQQQERIEEYSDKLQREFGSKEIKAVMGDAPDYTLLAFLHLDATNGKERLFGGKYHYNYARTKTPTSSSDVAHVGSFHAYDGLAVNDWHADDGYGHVRAAPLVVPG